MKRRSPSRWGKWAVLIAFAMVIGLVVAGRSAAGSHPAAHRSAQWGVDVKHPPTVVVPVSYVEYSSLVDLTHRSTAVVRVRVVKRLSSYLIQPDTPNTTPPPGSAASSANAIGTKKGLASPSRIGARSTHRIDWGLPATESLVEVLHTSKGPAKPGEQIVVSQPGGVNSVGQVAVMENNPLVMPEETEVLFLRHDAEGKYGILARYAVTADGTVHQIMPVLRPGRSYDGKTLRELEDAVAAASR